MLSWMKRLPGYVRLWTRDHSTLLGVHLRAPKRYNQILIVGCLIAALTVGVTMISIWMRHDATILGAQKRVLDIANVIAAHAQQNTDAADEILRNINSSIEDMNLENETDFIKYYQSYQSYKYLSDRVIGLKQINSVLLVNLHGRLINNSSRFLFDEYDLSNRDHIRYQMNNLNDKESYYVGRPQLGSFSNEIFLPISRISKNQAGKKIGIIVAGLKDRYFSEFYKSLNLPAGYVVSIVHSDASEFTSFPQADDMNANYPAWALKVKEASQGGAGVLIVNDIKNPDGGDMFSRMVALKAINGSPLVAAVSLRLDFYLARWKHNSILAGLGSCILALIIVWTTFYSRRMFIRLESARLEALAHAGVKTRFLAAISHEIRTPMNVISGSSELLLDYELAPEPKKHAAAIARSSKHLLHLINDVLDFARLEAKMDRIETSTFELRPALENTFEIARFLPDAEGLSLRLVMADDLPQFLNGDCGRMSQVLLNLLSNAVKFTDYGSVELAVTYEAGKTLVLAVSDTGCGITDQDLATLFEPFDRGQGVNRIEGTGLGLAICKQLVETMNGSIHFRSTVGCGSTFTVELPMVRAFTVPKPASAQVANRTHDAPQALNVLVVEDFAANRMLLDAVLRKLGHKTQLANNGVEALDIVKRRRFDVIFMDVQMPHMDGIEATRHIRCMPDPVGQAPIIALTAFVEPEQRAEMLEAGMDDILAKPFQKDQIASVLSRFAPGSDDGSNAHREQPRCGQDVSFQR